MNSIALHVEETAGASLHVGEPSTLGLGVGGGMYAVGPPRFAGPYEVTPSASGQTLEMAGLTARQDVVVKPIPSNYGLITWDGSVITVS